MSDLQVAATPTDAQQQTPSVREGGTELRRLFLLRPDVVFLNHGSFGACPRPVFEVYQQWQQELEHQPVEFLGRRFNDLLRTARESLAAYVNADPDDLVYLPNATTGLNVVARSLPLQAGDEVLSTDHEYGAMERTWRFVCEKLGARYITQQLLPPFKSAEQVVEAIWRGVTARTRAIFLSHITSPTAIILPVAELVRRARAAGIFTVIDGAHALGQIPLDLAALGADFYTGNCHKWLCAPKGAAFLHARREMQSLLEPLVVSWGWRSETPGPSRFIDEQQWQGTRDIAAYLSVPAAIQFQADHHWPRVQAHCHALVQAARQAIGSLTGLAPLTPDSPSWYAQMVTLPLPAGADGRRPADTQHPAAKALQRRLYDEFAIEVPILAWRERPFVRVSIQAYNTQADVDALVTALATLLDLQAGDPAPTGQSVAPTQRTHDIRRTNDVRRTDDVRKSKGGEKQP
jgi:isopenicillin-N epimerase